MKINREELAWAAGFFDGEGYVHAALNKANGRRYARVEVGQVEQQPLARFQRAILGLGRLYYKPAKQVKCGGWWRLAVGSYEDVQAIFALLFAFLSDPKKRQFRETLLSSKPLQYKRHYKRPKRVS